QRHRPGVLGSGLGLRHATVDPALAAHFLEPRGQAQEADDAGAVGGAHGLTFASAGVARAALPMRRAKTAPISRPMATVTATARAPVRSIRRPAARVGTSEPRLASVAWVAKTRACDSGGVRSTSSVRIATLTVPTANPAGMDSSIVVAVV